MKDNIMDKIDFYKNSFEYIKWKWFWVADITIQAGCQPHKWRRKFTNIFTQKAPVFAR
jgi:hypothetical protein